MTKSSKDQLLRRAYRFVLLVALAYVAITPLWWWISPQYSKALCFVANPVLNAIPFTDDKLEYWYDDGKIRSNVEFSVVNPYENRIIRLRAKPFWDGRLLHFSFTIWVALIVATPYHDLRRKLLYFFAGWIIVIVGQVLALYLHTLDAEARTLRELAELEMCKLPALEKYLLAWGGRFFMRIGNKLLPILLWLAVGLPVLLKRQNQIASHAHSGRDALDQTSGLKQA